MTTANSLLFAAKITDISILLLCHAHSIPASLWIDLGLSSNNTRRIINMSDLAEQLGACMPVCNALVSLHACTGCDFTAAFMRKGKVRPYQLMVKHQKRLDNWESLSYCLQTHLRSLSVWCMALLTSTKSTSQDSTSSASHTLQRTHINHWTKSNLLTHVAYHLADPFFWTRWRGPTMLPICGNMQQCHDLQRSNQSTCWALLAYMCMVVLVWILAYICHMRLCLEI